MPDNDSHCSNDNIGRAVRCITKAMSKNTPDNSPISTPIARLRINVKATVNNSPIKKKFKLKKKEKIILHQRK